MRKDVLKFVCMTLTIIMAHSLKGQHSDINFLHYTTEEGLSQNTVTSVIQDKRGFIWIGTRDGLNKFDGYKFVTYKNQPDDSNSLSSNLVASIMDDGEGNLWVGTESGGLNFFDRKKEKFLHFIPQSNKKNSLSHNHVKSVYKDSKGKIWVGTSGGGLNLFDPVKGTFKHYNKGTGHPFFYVSQIKEDRNGTLWVGSIEGLFKYDSTTDSFLIYNHNSTIKNALCNNEVKAIEFDRTGQVWIGTSKGLSVLNPKNGKVTNYFNNPNNTNSISHNDVRSILEDKFGKIWIGVSEQGLNLFDPETGKFERFKFEKGNTKSLSGNTVISLFQDRAGNVWAGTFTGGVNFYYPGNNKFHHYKNEAYGNSLSYNNVYTFSENSKGQIWIGTDGGGLNLLDRKTNTFSVFKKDKTSANSISSDVIIHLLQDKQGQLWIATWEGGLCRYDEPNKKFVRYPYNIRDGSGLSSPFAWHLADGRDGSIWIGTMMGALNRLEKNAGKFTYFNSSPPGQGVSNGFVTALMVDPEGNLWIGTNGSGVDVLEKKSGKFHHYAAEKGVAGKLSDDIVNNILQDSKGRIWIATNGGLNQFIKDTKTFVSYRESDGLPNNIVQGILEDGHRNLWISTNRGLSKFNPDKKTFRNYTPMDGLQSNSFNRSACFKSSTGEFYFGGSNGFNVFHPDSIKDNPYVPEVVITDLQIFNKSVVPLGQGSPLTHHISETEAITLSYKESVITLEFASLNFISSTQNQYAYKLEGFDKDWNEVGNKRNATYTNLDDGEYVFRVKASNNDGVWNEIGTSIKIKITPPFWKTMWFRILVGLTVTGSVMAFFRIRMNIVKAQKKELEKQVKERTAELRLANTELIEQKEEIIQQKEEILAQREKIEELYIDMKDSIRAAQAIQQSILPSEVYIKKYFPESFILFKPKDVVSGDFYWFDVIDNKPVIASVDCTGHGVSGALMSITGHHLLNLSVLQTNELKPSAILDRLNQEVIREMHHQKDNEEVQDGMDIALCVIDRENKKLQYAGANNPLYLVRGNEVIQVRANGFPIGLTINNTVNNYTNHEIDLLEGDIVYMFSDGYADQIGGENGQEKFMYPRFRNLILDIKNHEMKKQMELLDDAMQSWRKEIQQLDDIMIIGIKV